MHTTLPMSTGPTFGTIASLPGLSHGIIDQAQYSTLVANAFCLLRHLLPPVGPEAVPAAGLMAAGKTVGEAE